MPGPHRTSHPTRRWLARVLLCVMCAATFAAVAPAQQAATAPVETSQSAQPDARLDAWRDHIRPGDAERAWERIGWHASFADGLRAADAARKPLLLWMMNGHPLGCT